MNRLFRALIVVIAIWWGIAQCSAQSQPNSSGSQARAANAATTNPATDLSTLYVLGPDDQISIRVLDVDEIDPTKPIRVDVDGFVDVGLIGKIKAAGLTVDQLEASLTQSLKRYVQNPKVSVIVTDYRSQPVSVLGAVNAPGVYSLTGPNTIVEALSKAGGLRPDSGDTIHITRLSSEGNIPLASATIDPSHSFSTATLEVKALLSAKNPQEDILVKPGDVISVPRADLVYVVGTVRQPGSFPLTERQDISVLQALSMAQGLDKGSAPKHAKILRGGFAGQKKEMIPVNLSDILRGKAPDLPLMANDILFVPTNTAKNAGLRAIEAALQAGTLAGGYAAIHY
jgi:polysaccharide biosynthesis/export protein